MTRGKTRNSAAAVRSIPEAQQPAPYYFFCTSRLSTHSPTERGAPIMAGKTAPKKSNVVHLPLLFLSALIPSHPLSLSPSLFLSNSVFPAHTRVPVVNPHYALHYARSYLYNYRRRGHNGGFARESRGFSARRRPYINIQYATTWRR